MTRQVEPAWDDETRTLALALQRHDDNCCPGCGLHESILNDPDNNRFTFDSRKCKVCEAQAVYGRMLSDEHTKQIEKMGKEPSPRLPRPGDGLHVYLRRVTDEESTKRRRRR